MSIYFKNFDSNEYLKILFPEKSKIKAPNLSKSSLFFFLHHSRFAQQMLLRQKLSATKQ
jgi:hypothetical protein